MDENWQPPLSPEEKLKRLIPPKLYIRYRARKEALKGEAEIHLLPFLASRTRTAVDIGANKGVYSYFLAKLCPRVHAFEPHPKLFPILKAAAAPNVTCHQVALSDAAGVAELRLARGRHGYYSNMGGTLSAVKVPDGADYKSVRVEAKRLDDCGLTDVGFIKIDVEGYEMAVLAGARETMARDRPILLVELEEGHAKRPLPDMIADVLAYGYRGVALAGGVLTPVETFDVERWHRKPQTVPKRPGYVRNFIFLPV